MPQEIERKYLVKNDTWRHSTVRSVRYRQGYLNELSRCSVRVRVDADQGYLNIKSATLGVQRTEYEYPIPIADANEMLDHFCTGSVIEKTRHFVPFADHMWEVDVFEGDNAGLVVAEVELRSISDVPLLPEWVGKEVSDDPRYYNVSLVKHPYKDW